MSASPVRSRRPLVASLKLACCALALVSLPAMTAPLAAATAETGVTTQLPDVARPIHYAISIKPDMTGLRFDGTAKIDIEVLKPTTTITLNAADLTFASARVTGGPKAVVTVDAGAQTATLTFDAPLKPGKTTLEIVYSGIINQQANGLFALDYTDVDGKKARAIFTQFEPADARRLFPGWDEPAFKATFDVTAVVPAGQMVVGNMPIASTKPVAGGLEAVSFQTSPKMSTYLVFLAAGDLERIKMMAGDTEVGIVTSRGQSEKARFALESEAKIIPYFNDYFGVPFPLPKLDTVAGPGQSQFFSAMENWGAIFTFELALLNDPKLTTPKGYQNIFATGAHETAHQWFGDLVTMKWWNDLWLNEGFASWMENKTTAHFFPEWQAELDRVSSRERAMDLDARVTTHPIVQKVETVDQMNQAFDDIAYHKGSSVIAMLESTAGETGWRDGMRIYMKRHAYGNTTTADLWKAQEDAGAKGLAVIAHDFTNQPGIPLLKVAGAKCEGGSTRVSLAQGEFSSDRKAKTDATPQSWHVPVIARTLGNAPVRAVIAGGKGEMLLPGCAPVLINAGQAGYFRTLYTPAEVAALRGQFAQLEPRDQFGLVRDGLALSRAGYQPMGASLDLLAQVDSKSSAKVQQELLGSWQEIYDLFADDPATQAAIVARVSARFGPSLERLGFAAKAGEPLLDTALRSQLISTLGNMGDPRVLAEARRLFAKLDTDKTALDGPQRQSWLAIVARFADAPTWDKLHGLARTADTALERSTLYTLLGRARDPALAKRALELALTDEPSKTVAAAIISAVSAGHPDLATDFALAHMQQVDGLIDASSRARYIARLADDSRDPAMIAKLRAYARDHLPAESRSSVEQAINQMETRAVQEPGIRSGVKAWLAD